jgi:ATP-binding cassette subfamily B protein
MMKFLGFFKIHKHTAVARLFLYLWPKDSLVLRLRFLIALLALFLSKLTALAVPLFLKYAIDDLNTLSLQGWLTVPLYFLLSYGFLRIVSSFFNEARIAIFAPVESQATRRIAVQIFSHLHMLSLRFHLDKRTGGLSRAVERGVKAVDSFLWFTVNAFIPAFFELLFVTVAMWVLYDWRYATIAFFTIQLYVVFTILFTEWRTRIQRQLNTVDSQSNARSVDALLNYETVKYFTNEDFEIERFDQLSECYAKLMIMSKNALAFLNFGQGIIIALGLTIIMILAAWDVTEHHLTVGDFVLVK